ncbi:MAG: hypothetical protein ACLRVQ_02130 [Lachnospiraceae bacterium]
MKEFLEDLLNIIKKISSAENPQEVERDESTANHMRQEYSLLSESERQQMMEVIYDLAGNDKKLYLYMLSIVVSFVKDVRILKEIYNELLHCDFDVIYSMNLCWQSNRFIFTNNIENSDSLFELKKEIYEKNIRNIRVHIKNRDYIPYGERQKRVVLVIAPLLNKGHAPSVKLDNMAYWLGKLGYDIMVVSLNSHYIQISHSDDWWKAKICNTLSRQTILFELDFNLTKLKGYYVMFDDDNYFDMTNNIIGKIYEYNPEFVMMIGDYCPVADLCSDFTTVITMACKKNNPITIAPIIARYFEYSKEEEQIYKSHLGEGQVIVDVKSLDIVKEGIEKYTKEQFGNDEKDFLVCIAGNRLDIEVSTEMINILNGILKDNKEVKIVFIGDCPKLKSVLQKNIYKERYDFWGYQRNFKAAIGACDLFLNPPRQGGGLGAYYACEQQVPVITLPHCDCSNVGESFICNSIDEMPELVHRYIHDNEFMDKQKAQCRIKTQEWQSRDNLREIQNMCDFVKEYALKIEDEK